MGIERNVFTSDRAHQKHRRRRLIASIGVCVGILAIIGCAVVLARLDSLRIKNIQVEGAHTELETQIRSTIDKHLSENILWVFPRWNRFLFKTEYVETKLARLYPKIQNVRVQHVGLSGLRVSIEERKMFGVWCDGVAPMHTGFDANVGNCYAIDDTGYIFAPSPYFSNHAYFEFFGKSLHQPAHNTVDGSTNESEKTASSVYSQSYVDVLYLPQEVFLKVRDFVEMLKNKSIFVHTLIVHDGDFFELVLKEGGAVRFSPSQDLVKIANDLETGIAKEFEEQPNKKKSDIEYIDMRFPNKVIFKFIE